MAHLLGQVYSHFHWPSFSPLDGVAPMSNANASQSSFSEPSTAGSSSFSMIELSVIDLIVRFYISCLGTMPYIPPTKPSEPLENTKSTNTPSSAFRENDKKSKKDESDDRENDSNDEDSDSRDQSSGEQDCRYCIIV
jgi:hypothetical protein